MDHNKNIQDILENAIKDLCQKLDTNYQVGLNEGLLTAQRLVDEYFEQQIEILKPKPDPVNHPEHYGGKDNPYEAIKVIEAHNLNFRTGNAVKYILRAGKKGDPAQDIKKAIWYLERELNNLIQVL